MPFALLRESARRVARVAADVGMTIDIEEYVESFRPDLMEIVASWTQGARFADIIKMSKIFEVRDCARPLSPFFLIFLAAAKTLVFLRCLQGSLVRAIRRLEELLVQLSGGLRSIGDMEMAEKVEKAAEKIKRDVIFAASLFL